MSAVFIEDIEIMKDSGYCVIEYNNGDDAINVDYFEQERVKELFEYNKLEIISILGSNLNEEGAKKVLKHHK